MHRLLCKGLANRQAEVAHITDNNTSTRFSASFNENNSKPNRHGMTQPQRTAKQVLSTQKLTKIISWPGLALLDGVINQPCKKN